MKVIALALLRVFPLKWSSGLFFKGYCLIIKVNRFFVLVPLPRESVHFHKSLQEYFSILLNRVSLANPDRKLLSTRI